MSWPTQRKVRLAVTKFAPAPDTPVAGLSDEQRAALRERRARETRKVEPALEQEVFRDFNIFMYGNFVQVERIEPCPDDCRCDLCARIAERRARKRQPYDELYLKQRSQADGI